MHYQNDNSLAGDWLFGTTRSTNHGATDKPAQIWMVDLDANLMPLGNSLIIYRLDEGKLQTIGYITGVKPKMVGYEMSMVFRKDDDKLFYVTMDMSQAKGAKFKAQ